jgi:hypothetical protein
MRCFTGVYRLVWFVQVIGVSEEDSYEIIFSEDFSFSLLRN